MKSDVCNILQLLEKRSQEFPKKEAFIFLGDGENVTDKLSFQDLDLRVKETASFLQNLNSYEKGERAILMIPPGIDYIVCFFGCIISGLIPVPTYPPGTKSFNRIKHIFFDANPKYIFGNQNLYQKLVENKFENTDNSWETELLKKQWVFPPRDGVRRYKPMDFTKNDIAFIQYTSGSTSNPKGAMISHGNLLHNAYMADKYFGFSPSSTMVSWLPPYHDMGLIGGIFQPLYSGMTSVLMSPMSFLKKPIRWLRAISNCNIGEDGFVVSGAPNFAFDYCTAQLNVPDSLNLNLEKWKIAFTGSEPVKAGTLQQFYKKFKKYGFKFESFYPVYGLAEATLLVTAGTPFNTPVIREFNLNYLEKGIVRLGSSETKNSIKLIGCGKILEEQTLLIVNPHDHSIVEENKIGEIFLSGPSVAQGYYNNEALSRSVFNSHVVGFGNQKFLRTGDFGFITEKSIFILGRGDELIVIRGKNYFPSDLESSLRGIHKAIRDNCCCVFSVTSEDKEKLVFVCELKKGKYFLSVFKEINYKIRKKIFEQFSLQIDDVILITQSSLFKTTSGKIQRNLVKKAFVQNNLKILHSSNKNIP